MTEPIEKLILGSIINVPSYFSEAESIVTPEHFEELTNKSIWNKLSALHKEDGYSDMATFCATITLDDQVLGITAPYVVDCTHNANQVTGYTRDTWTDKQFDNWLKALHDAYIKRVLKSKLESLSKDVMDNNPETFSHLLNVHTELSNLIDMKPGQKFLIKNQLDDTIKSIENSEVNLLKTNYPDIDKLSGGLTRGEITIIGGRPGHGKTTIMLNLIRKAVHNGLKVLVFNREMSNVEMLKKLLVLESDGELSYTMIRQGVFSDLDHLAKVQNIKSKMEELYSEDKFLMFDNLPDMASSSAEVKRFKPDIVFDDYIQLIRPEPGQDQRRLQLEKIVHDYKWLSKSIGCATILLSQLNRMMETRGDSRPRLSDLAESGAIEQVAENVFFIFYEYKVSQKDGKAHEMELIASKVRYGTSGIIKLAYQGDKVKIYNNEQEWIEDNARKKVKTNDIPA